MQSAHFGQHFTPQTVSEANAEMPIGGTDSSSGDDAPETVLDPACGSGRLLSSAARHIDHGKFTGIDQDPICAKMAVLNLALFGMTGHVIHGDSLAMDSHRVWTVEDGCIVERDPSGVNDAELPNASVTMKGYRVLRR